jgi:hypothetical protein
MRLFSEFNMLEKVTGGLQAIRLRWVFSCLGIWAALGATACDQGDSGSGYPSVRDSSGVRIVESSAPVWSRGDAWTVSPSPVLRIGNTIGDEQAQLYRVGDVTRLSDGRILVANSGANEIGVYSPTGDFIRAIGREGPGPGEFTDPRRLWVLPGDTLVVADWTRISVFDSTGQFLRSDIFGPWPIWDRFPDGSFLRLVIPPGKDPFLPGYFHPDYAVVRARADESEADTLAFVAGDEMYRWSSASGGIASFRSPFGRTRTAVAHGDSIFTGDGSAFEIQDLDENGGLVRIIRRSAEPEPVTDSAIQAFEAAILERTEREDLRRERNRMFSEWTYPPFQPSYDRLLLDGLGNLWVRHYSAAPGPRVEWTVFNSDGRWLGVIPMPGGMTVKEIGSDYVLGVWTGEFGVEYVNLYALNKPGGGP